MGVGCPDLEVTIWGVVGIFSVMLEDIDRRVLRCGQPRLNFLGIQAERVCFAGVSLSSRMSFPTKVSCLLRICCSMVWMWLNFLRIDVFLMWSSLTVAHFIPRILRIAPWWNALRQRRDCFESAQLLHPQRRRFMGMAAYIRYLE